MALTPHMKDPNREKHLKDINKMMSSGEEGRGKAKADWNHGPKDETPADKAKAAEAKK